MKLPDFFSFEPLNLIKEKMGVPRNVYGVLTVLIDPSRLTEEELKKLTSSSGIDISPDELSILADGTLAYKNNRILLYIRDMGKYEPRFHLANCSTLQEMREKKKFDHYVVSANTDGNFKVNIIEANVSRAETRRLAVCQNCLDFLGLGGFSSTWTRKAKTDFVANFNMESFFEKYPKSLHFSVPKYNSNTAPLNQYSADFNEVSKKLRASVYWQCQQCGIHLQHPDWRKWLHVHHINGLKNDNSSDNLKAICIECHAQEPNHSHMKNTVEFKEFLRLFNK